MKHLFLFFLTAGLLPGLTGCRLNDRVQNDSEDAYTGEYTAARSDISERDDTDEE